MISASIAGSARADRLDGQLVVLAVAAAPGRAVAVHRRDRVRLHRLRLAMHAVLEVGARDRRGAFGTKRQRAVAAVGEGVHLLVHDVGRLARRAREEPGVLEAGRLDAAPAVERGHLLHRANELPPRCVVRQHVVRAARRLELLLASRLRRPARRAARAGTGSSRARGRASSPGRARDGRPSRAETGRAAPAPSRAASPSLRPGRSTRPTEPAKSRSPEKSSPSAWNATCPAEWPGTSITSNVDAGDGRPRRRP